jgi:hypothetical protein
MAVSDFFYFESRASVLECGGLRRFLTCIKQKSLRRGREGTVQSGGGPRALQDAGARLDRYFSGTEFVEELDGGSATIPTFVRRIARYSGG